MDKGRAIIVNALTLIRERAGEGELINCPKHSYWEACKLIEKNNWQEEANEYYRKLVEEETTKVEIAKEEYYKYLISNEKDEELEFRIKEKLQKFNINGEAEESVKFKVKYGREPEFSELKEILKKRKEEDYETAKVFFKNHVKIYLGKNFNKKELLEATKKLKERGLYKVALKYVPFAINHELAKKYNPWGDNRDFSFTLY